MEFIINHLHNVQTFIDIYISIFFFFFVHCYEKKLNIISVSKNELMISIDCPLHIKTIPTDIEIKKPKSSYT